MKANILYIVFLFCFAQIYHAQDDGVVAFDLPVRSSLKFNKYAINPAFSFVREQNKYITFTNKREWVQFDNAPETYLFSYSGRFRENIGAGIGVFQQNYGVLTTFGGIANFAYNAVINRDSNLTFGINLGFYKSGINEGNVVTNFSDPSLNNIPSSSVITINPGINYGTTFFDFGVSINNLASYNLTASKIIKDNPQQSIQAHIMYTGYVNSRGFFDESKFSTLFQSEFSKDKTILSGLMMLTVPKGIWAQAGYNTLYGVSVGIGLNITKQIALEYNYEKAIGDLSTFGNSHEITLAYKFKNNFRYYYSGDDNEEALLISGKKRRPNVSKPKSTSTIKVDREAIAAENKRKLQEKAALVAHKKAEAKAKEEAKVKLVEEQRIKEKQAKADEEIRLQKETEVKRLEEEAKAKLAEEQRFNEEQAKADEEIRLQKETEVKRLEEEAKAKLAEEQRFNEEQAKADEEIRLQKETEIKRLEEARARAAKEAEKKIDTVQLDGVLVSIARDREALAMKSLTELTETSKIEQQNLLINLREKIAIKQQDLDDLKEENDLGDQGIYTAPKPFKSVTAENAALESIKLEIDNVIESQSLKISELENLYNERRKTFENENDPTNVYFLRKIQELKLEQSQIKKSKENLLSTLDDIKEATEFERRRRIKRAAYDNQEDRYNKDRAALNQIKQFTEVSSVELTEDDFDFGEEQTSNIQIVKDVKNEESGYYLVVAVHSDVEKRNEFLTKAVSAGQTNIDFFFDVNTSKYYIYYEKFNNAESAKDAVDSKENKPYNSKISILKIEN